MYFWQRIIYIFCVGFVGFYGVSSLAKDEKLIVIGGGHIGLMKVLLANERSKRDGDRFEAVVYTKDKTIEETTAANIWNSHTHDEFGAVIPPVEKLPESMSTPFNEGGVLVPDVIGILEHASSKRFLGAVYKRGSDVASMQEIKGVIAEVGSASMKLWRKLYQNANDDLKTIMEECNFNPCTDSEGAQCKKLYSGYRIDLIYNVDNAHEKALGMIKGYQSVGYQYSKILTPDEVLAMDKNLAEFVEDHSQKDSSTRVWKKDAIAVWRPGGCIDTQRFLPKLVEYLRKDMGDRFAIHFDKKVVGVDLEKTLSGNFVVRGLKFADGTTMPKLASYDHVWFDFNPGEAVGTLENLGFDEPPYAGFAGCSLSLTVPLNDELLVEFQGFKHHMEVHTPDKVLAWQARLIGKEIFVGGAGTKAFYGPFEPNLNQQFAQVNNLAQLQMFNDVLPRVVSLALGLDTRGATMAQEQLQKLVEQGKARRWVGRRSARFDNMFTTGFLYHGGRKVENALTGTHAGSGGGSLSPILSLFNSYLKNPEQYQQDIVELGWSREFIEKVYRLADSRTVH